MFKYNEISIFNILSIALVSIGFIWYLIYRRGRKNLYKLAAKIPHVNCRSLPFIGMAHKFLGTTGMLEMVTNWASLNTLTKLWIGPSLLCIVYKPEDLEIVLNSRTCLQKHFFYDVTKFLTGQGLFTANVAKWKVQRKLIQPTFNQTILNKFVDNFATQANVFVQLLRNDLEKTIDIEHKLANWGIDSICESAIGVQINAQTTDCLLAQTINKGWRILMDRVMTFYYHSDFIFHNSALYKEAMEVKNDIFGFIEILLKEKHIIHNNTNFEIEDSDKGNYQSKFKTFLDLFMELKNENGRLTDEELQDETFIIFIAGSDTSKQTVGFILQMIGMFPEVQQKVYEEIIDIIGPNRKVEYTDLPKLVYTERVIKEAMRLYPIGPFIGRAVGEDLDLTSHTLPKGCGVVISPIMVHRSPLYWKDPLTFDPDRFLPEEVAKRHPYTYIPFSAGPRNCIGYKYAMMSMKTFIAIVVREYVLKTPHACIEDFKCDADLLLKPVNGFPMSFKARN